MKIKAILILALICLTFSAAAQDKPRKGRFDIETLKKEKSEYLKKELNLTEKEIKEFIPLEAEFTTKKFEIYRNARTKTRDLRRKENKTDADYQKITQTNLEAEQQDAKLQMEYFQKFSKVLPAEKIEKYRSADLKFKEAALKRHEEQHRGRDAKRK
ncbi:MAG: hypothetical protein ACK5M3_17295 [Dysgonomonas sp.]|jgi:hypothetical protein